MLDLATFSLPTDSHLLLHCRPRIRFHLGHVKMLNVLHKLLIAGHRLTILIIPYDEHDQGNRTVRTRLHEECKLTAGFYGMYLGFAKPQLTIIDTTQLDLSAGRLREINERYVSLYESEDQKVVNLVDRYKRSWASPNVTFVAKCVAAIEALRPDFLLAGDKHRLIAEGFQSLMCALGHQWQYAIFKDFLDLHMRTAMDSRDSVETYIDINDNEDFALQKLSLLRDTPKIRLQWLDAFVDEIVVPAPERVKAGVGRVFRSEAEQELVLTRFLSNVRKCIPYDVDRNVPEVDISWSDDLLNRLSEDDRHEIERIGRSLYSELGAAHVTLLRTFNDGQSGSMVFEVRQHADHAGHILDNVSVLKIGPADELRNEKTHYDEVIQRRRTAAFMEVKGGSRIAGGKIGIAYQGAEHFLGVPAAQRLGKISDLFVAGARANELSDATSRLNSLMSEHLFRVLWSHNTLARQHSIRHYLNEFLPSESQIFVNQINASENRLYCERKGDAETQESVEVKITELSLSQCRARAFTLNTNRKIDIYFDGKNELLVNALAIGARLSATGRLMDTRDGYYRKRIEGLGLARQEGFIIFSDKEKVRDATARIDDLLNLEFDEVALSPVHGDLHSGNVLCSQSGFGIIDYGKTRKSFPSLYDVVLLTSHIQLTVVRELDDEPKQLLSFAKERSGFGSLWPRRSRTAELFAYQELPREVRSLGDERLFYVLKALVLLGMLKFNLTQVQGRAAVILAALAMQRSGLK